MAQLIADSMAGAGDVAVERWAASGAMALTGAADGPPLASTARVAPAVDALASHIAEVTGRLGRELRLDGAALLGERAAIAGLGRRGGISCGGATSLLRARDGWFAVALARPTDLELLDAWLGQTLGVSTKLPMVEWEAVAAMVAKAARAELVDTAVLLGLPCASLGEVPADGPLVEVSAVREGRDERRAIDGFTIVDLSSLWAGPLCAHVLGAAGARVIKVESATRPDGARLGPPGFFDLLHAGHESVALDFAADNGRRWLRRLIETADVVIEASRPRALAALGVSFDQVHEAGWRGVWVSITGYGRSGDAGRRVAFGDDAAVAGGLVSEFEGSPMFCADAVADPVSGLVAAASVLRFVDQGITGIIDVALARTAAHLAAGVQRHPPPYVTPVIQVAAPRARIPAGKAAPIGTHTDAVLSTL